MNIALQPNEILVRSGYANHFIGVIGMVGKLFLTNQRLCFVTHPLNFRHYTLSFPLSTVARVLLHNNLKIFTHGIVIRCHDGASHRFAVWRRKQWKQMIEATIKNGAG